MKAATKIMLVLLIAQMMVCVISAKGKGHKKGGDGLDNEL